MRLKNQSILPALCILFCVSVGIAQNFPNGFEFYMPPFDSTTSAFLPDFPADSLTLADRVQGRANGKFYANGVPIRFWGVNLSAAGCFPEKADAPLIAARMRKMGINLVRFHHADNPAWSGSNSSLLMNGGTTRQLNMVALDKMEFFIAQLKANGIYVNMNLNVSRTFQANDGVVAYDSIQDFGKAITLYHPYLQFLQREFADQLFSHVNPYTGMTLASDPVLAMTEMNNENSLYAYWRGDNLTTYAEGGILPVHYDMVLDSLWQDWLSTEYPSSRDLANAWNAGVVPTGTGELLLNGGFESGNPDDAWNTLAMNGAVMTSRIEPTVRTDGNYGVSFRASTLGADVWNLQYYQTGFSLKKDTTYAIRFRARVSGNTAQLMDVFIQEDSTPYTMYAYESFTLDQAWRTYEILLTPTVDITDLAKLAFCPNGSIRRYYLDEVSIRPLYQSPNSSIGFDQVQNGGFESGTNPWQVELHSTAAATLTASTTHPHSGSYAGHFDVTTVTGTNWHIQLKQAGVSIEKDSTYFLKFWARSATGASDMSITLMRDNAPYTWYTGTTIQLSTTWQEYSLSLIAPETNTGHLRVAFGPFQNTGSFYIDDVVFGKPLPSGLLAGENLQDQSVERILFSDKNAFSDKRVADLTAFYTHLEKTHLENLRLYLKDSLNVASPITGSNALTGIQDAYRHLKMDYLDDHAYWDHPQFPNIPWSNSDWFINNEAMVKSQWFSAITGVTSGLSMRRKPYTISEYNHGALNRFRTEMVPALAAYSAFHGVDGIMWFEYNTSFDWTSDIVNGHFSLHRDNSIMALFPSCAYAYRKGYMSEDRTPIKLSYSPDWVFRSAKADPNGRWGSYVPYDPKIALEEVIHIENFIHGATPDFSQIPTPSMGNLFTTSTNQTSLDNANGILTTKTQRYSSITGFLHDAPALTRAGFLRLLSGSDFGVVTWLAVDDRLLRSSRKSLLTISSKQQNTGMIWNATNTSVNANWGTSPTVQNPLQVSLRMRSDADSICIYPLDEMGQPLGACTMHYSSNGNYDVNFDQSADETLWYGIDAFFSPPTTSRVGVGERHTSPVAVDLYPNPAQTTLALGFEGQIPDMLQVFDAAGRKVLEKKPESMTEEISVSDLMKGVYSIQFFWENQNIHVERFVKM